MSSMGAVHQPLLVFKDAKVLNLVGHPYQVYLGVVSMDTQQDKESLGNGPGNLAVDFNPGL